jgi:hypothetical protein
MSSLGFTISKIAVEGQGKPDAVLAFGPGLNVVAGATDTGKSYVWHAIDFMLGAEILRKDFPLAAGYSRALIELRPRSGGVVTLTRALAGGGALKYLVPMDAVQETQPELELKAKHDASDQRSISGLLLGMTGLWGKRVRKNQSGGSESLSFRLLAHHSLVEEVRIQTEESPVDLGDSLLQSPRRAAFGLLLTGVDDADIVAQESAKERKYRYELQMSVLEGLLDDREVKLRAFSVDPTQLAGQRARMAAAVQEATSLLATRQAELDDAATTRDRAWSAIETLKSKRLFVAEQVKRLELLEQHYASDKARLESALEAGEFFERLPTGECPVCGNVAGAQEEGGASDERLREFQQACAAELGKIAVLARDLGITLSAMRSEDQGHAREQASLQGTLDRANAAINGLLDRKVRSADEQLSRLLAEQARLAEAAFAAGEVLDLQNRFSMLEQQRNAKPDKVKIAPKVGAAGTAEFCGVVEKTLRAWKFPFEGHVSWADKEFDLVIGGQNRGSMGKGSRAITHAAFTVALMRYCRAKHLPHPGIVMLDTPLNPYRGADKTAKDSMNMDVQEAFYADLAADASGDQVIVFENTEPPLSLMPKMQYTHFSGNVANPRVGFFPMPPPSTTVAASR